MDGLLNNKYGSLLSEDIKLFREWFDEMIELIGIKVIYYPPRNSKYYSDHTEVHTTIEDSTDRNQIPTLTEGIITGCIFEEHPQQQTLKKLGWISELQEDDCIISVPYDLPDLQQGALFLVPSGLDNATGRLFRVTKLTNSIVYPASITCQIVPEYQNEFSIDLHEHKHNTFNLLYEEGDDCP